MQLEALQRSMIDAIEHGPDFIAEQTFAGSRAAALRGLAVHANTISHARLVALEETFPRTREYLGAERFNAVSRAFVARAEAKVEPLATIGRHFPEHLDSSQHGPAQALAAFEWAWLECYYAGEAPALMLSELAGADEEKLLATVLAHHPAARLAPPAAGEMLEDEVPGLSGACAILLTRPQAEVLVSPASAAMVRLFMLSEEPRPICNLLAAHDEQRGEDCLQTLLAMIEAGSLVLT